MKADLSRDTFDPTRHFTRVLKQQGRVELDADANEQTAILWHYLRALTTHLIGRHAGPRESLGFEIAASGTTDFTIGAGEYYVDGLLCANDVRGLAYSSQDSYRPESDALENGGFPYLVYLEVYERHVSWVEDGRIREVALGGPDTAARARIEWRVRVKPAQTQPADHEQLLDLVLERGSRSTASLDARVGPHDPDDLENDCVASPEAGYRGPENQLYRVEVHRPGAAWNGEDAARESAATFKWSRENGSVIFPIRRASGTQVELDELGRDARLTLGRGDRVEILSESHVLQERAGRLLEVVDVDRAELVVKLSHDVGTALDLEPEEPLYLRRWDQHAGRLEEGGHELSEGAALIREDVWSKLEDGVEIRFESARENDPPRSYRTGDHWLIPARTATGLIEWPRWSGGAPHGVARHYAPLAWLRLQGGAIQVQDLRRYFEDASKPVSP